MALSAAQLKKYGLKATDASGSDHEKGIVSVGGQTYQIQGFAREQNEGIDTDQGKVFSSSLEKDSGKDFTNFNTATDVEQALEELTGTGDDDGGPTEAIVHSKEIQTAKERVKNWEEAVQSGQQSEDIFGPSNDDPVNKNSSADDKTNKAAVAFVNRQKRDVGKMLSEEIKV